MWGLLVAGVAHARLFAPPAPNVPNVDMNSGTWISSDTASLSAPLPPQPYVIRADPQTGYALQQPSGGSASFSALGVALVAAGFGVVAGQQAVLFLGGKSRNQDGKPARKADAGKALQGKDGVRRDTVRSGYMYRRPDFVQKGRPTVQTQRNGFGTFIQNFQKRDGNSKYGVPIFLPNGNVNPAYLAAERKDQQEQSKRNTKASEIKRKNLIKKGTFRLAGYITKNIGPVGSGKEFYQSGR